VLFYGLYRTLLCPVHLEVGNFLASHQNSVRKNQGHRGMLLPLAQLVPGGTGV
jgi:hypothetical protein